MIAYIYIYICNHENKATLPQSDCGKPGGEHIVFMIPYILRPSCFSEI